MVKLSRLEARVVLEAPLELVFAFHAEAANLETLTPPWLRFRILTRPPALRKGARIDYRLRIRGIPVRWWSVIKVWDPPRRFVDEQLRGPYQLWIHEHDFEDADGRTVCADRVTFAVPFGRLVERLLVRPDIERIFRYRHRRLGEIFGAVSGGSRISIEALP